MLLFLWVGIKVNSSPPSAAHMWQWIRLALVQIIWTSARSSSIGPLGSNLSEILTKIENFSFTNIHLKISCAIRWPFCPGGESWSYQHKEVHATIIQVHRALQDDVIKWKNLTLTGHLCGEFTGSRWITLTPYMVLPLFATRFADYAGGIRVFFL